MGLALVEIGHKHQVAAGTVGLRVDQIFSVGGQTEADYVLCRLEPHSSNYIYRDPIYLSMGYLVAFVS